MNSELIKNIIQTGELLKNSKGLFLHGLSEEVLLNLCELITTNFTNIEKMEITDVSINSLNSLKGKNILVINRLNNDELIANIDTLLEYFILPVIYSGKIVFFLSNTIIHKPRKLFSFEDLHKNYKEVVKQLRFEQFINLIRKYFFSYDSVNNSIVRPETIHQTRLDKDGITHAKIDTNLDENQKRAVTHFKGPIIVHSPAGSGKTRTIVNRIVFLLSSGIRPTNILAVAFNKKAAEEMRSRLKNLDILDVNVRTLHSIAYEILRDKYGWKFEDLPENTKYRKVINSLKNQANIGSEIIELISRSKMNLEKTDEIYARYKHLKFDYPEFLFSFIRKQFELGIFTFDDMIYFALTALISDSALRRKYQKRFDFVLVDEFQDLNNAQLEMCKLLAMPENNLYVVGDDDQMIYSWRGANIEHIINFKSENLLCKQVTLNINYRSALKIVQHSRFLIENNRVRAKKNITCFRNSINGVVEIYNGKDLIRQAKKIGKWILKNRQDNQDWSDFGILCRFNIHRLPIALQLKKMDIPFTEIEYDKLFETDLASEILRYLMIIVGNPNNTSTNIRKTLYGFFPHIPLNVLYSIGSLEDLKLIASQANEYREYYDKISELKSKLENSKLDTKHLLKTIIRYFRIEARFSRKRSINPESENFDIIVTTLYSIAELHPDVKDFIKIIGNPSQKSIDNKNQVYLSTIHRTKGNEFKNVAIFNYSDDIDIDSVKILEEERRVFYVAVTRAIDKLLITTHKKNPSPFIKELCI